MKHSKSDQCSDKDRWSSKAFGVSLVAIVLSFSSVFFSALQWKDSHDQLVYATKPLMLFDIEEDPKDPPVGIVIENNGAGPAIIKSLTYYIDDKPIGDWEKVEDYLKIDDDKFVHYELDEDYSVGASSRFWLVTYKSKDKKDTQEVNHLVDFLDQHLGIKLFYCSERGDCINTCSTKHMCGD